ncbi:MAG: hypothetical protein MH213_15570 [Marinobacter sp.]|nr:hypothetical protein [Marinobacter sp.]
MPESVCMMSIGKASAECFYLIGWYLYHLMTFWTIPNRLVEWEVKKIKRMSQKTLPKAMSEWSEPLPEEQWAKPSDELKAPEQTGVGTATGQPSKTHYRKSLLK